MSTATADTVVAVRVHLAQVFRGSESYLELTYKRL